MELRLFLEILNAQFALNMLLRIWQKPAKILCGGIQLKYRSQRFPKVEVKEKISSDSKITENVRKQNTMQMSQQKKSAESPPKTCKNSHSSFYCASLCYTSWLLHFPVIEVFLTTFHGQGNWFYFSNGIIF